MKSIMYHYVRPSGDSPPNYYYLDLDDFRRQLDYFEAEFGFVERTAFLRAITEETAPPPGVILTFDDGLRDHYEFVYPELEKRGLWGIFYVPTGQYATGRVLDVHRIHRLLGRLGAEAVLDELLVLVDEDMIPDARRAAFREETYSRQDDDEATTLTKRILNYYITYEYRTEVLDTLEARLQQPPVAVADVYLGPGEVREMHEDRMVFGAHSRSHRVLSKLSIDEQRAEIRDSFDWLEATVGEPAARTFCYPYGGDYSFTDETERLLAAADCQFAFSVESRDVETADVADRPLALPRYDCNEFPHGDASGGLG